MESDSIRFGKNYYFRWRWCFYFGTAESESNYGNIVMRYNYNKRKQSVGVPPADIFEELNEEQMKNFLLPEKEKKLIAREKEKEYQREYQRSHQQPKMTKEERKQMEAQELKEQERHKALMKDFFAALEKNDFEAEAQKRAAELKPYIKNYVIDKIIAYCDGETEIRKWYNDGCPYDFSGKTYGTGEYLSPDNTVEEVLLNYTGRTSASYVSHYGLTHHTIIDDINEDIEESSLDMVYALLKEFVVKDIIIDIDCEEIRDDGDFDNFIWETNSELDIDYLELSYGEYGYESQELYDIDKKTLVRDLVNSKQELPDNPFWNKIVKSAV